MKRIFLILTMVAFIACKEQSSGNNTAENESATTSEEVTTESNEEASNNSSPVQDEDLMAANIRNFLTRDYLKDDLASLNENDRKFQYAAIDLNGDGKDEYFIRFMSPYFCGTGGCSMVLIDHESNVITEFSVMEPPLWVEKQKVNGWDTILIKSGGELKALTYNNGSYPSNPSVVEKAPYDAASGNAYIMFDENFNPAKTYTF